MPMNGFAAVGGFSVTGDPVFDAGEGELQVGSQREGMGGEDGADELAADGAGESLELELADAEFFADDGDVDGAYEEIEGH